MLIFVVVHHNGEDDWEVRLIEQNNNVERENLFGKMNWVLFSLMD